MQEFVHDIYPHDKYQNTPLGNLVQIKKQLNILSSNCLIIKWEHTGSNRGPSACKADALNQLSYAPLIVWECKNRV